MQEVMSAGPSTREWTPIVTDNVDTGSDVGTADGTDKLFAVTIKFN